MPIRFNQTHQQRLIAATNDKKRRKPPLVCDHEATAVHFGPVNVRTYPLVLSNNPACSIGTPVELNWNYTHHEDFSSVEAYEQQSRGKQSYHHQHHAPVLNYYDRQALLRRAGYSDAEIRRGERAVAAAQRRRALSSLPSKVNPLASLMSTKQQWTIQRHVQKTLRREKLRIQQPCHQQ